MIIFPQSFQVGKEWKCPLPSTFFQGWGSINRGILPPLTKHPSWPCHCIHMTFSLSKCFPLHDFHILKISLSAKSGTFRYAKIQMHLFIDFMQIEFFKSIEDEGNVTKESLLLRIIFHHLTQELFPCSFHFLYYMISYTKWQTNLAGWNISFMSA